MGQGAAGSMQWTFSHAGQSARAPGNVAAGIDLAADRLAERYAPLSTRSTASVSLRIGGLTGVRDYAALTQYLEGLSLVRAVGVRELAGDTVQFELSVRGDRALLERIFGIERRLVPATPEPGQAPATAVDFIWQAT